MSTNEAEVAQVAAGTSVPATGAAAAEKPAIIEASELETAAAPVIAAAEQPIEMPKSVEMPKAVEAVMKAAEAMRPIEAATNEHIVSPAPSVEPAVAAAATAPAQSPTNRFALLAASVAFAGAFGAMIGALAVGSRSAPAGEQATPALDLTSVQNSITALRSEIAAVKTSVDGSNRNANAQFAKIGERFERVERAQAAPAAQLKQALDAIDRLEKRASASGETTGTSRPQPAAATPSQAADAAAQQETPRVVEGWVVRHVSRGVALIQGRRMGMIEVEAGDVVPGVGRVESIRRQDGRWVVVTSRGLIVSANAGPLTPPMPIPR
jgi:hypothetical protein